MSGSSVVVRPLVEGDLDRADRIFRTAFGTFLGVPEPAQFFGDADVVHTRWRTYPTAAFAAELDGELVGSNFASDWGSIGFFGPLTVRPDHWDQGIGRRLLEPTMDLLSWWQVRHLGLFTFAESTKHIGLYQSFGFWPRYLTAVMAAPVVAPPKAVSYRRYSELVLHYPGDPGDAVRDLTDAVYEGLDLGREIGAVLDQRLGETVLIDDATGLQGVAICHIGAGSEAGSGRCHVKFAAVRPGRGAARSFGRLIDACHDLAATEGATLLSTGVNFAREKAYTALRRRGFRSQMQGVTMHRPNEPGYDRSTSYVLDDWR